MRANAPIAIGGASRAPTAVKSRSRPSDSRRRLPFRSEILPLYVARACREQTLSDKPSNDTVVTFLRPHSAQQAGDEGEIGRPDTAAVRTFADSAYENSSSSSLRSAVRTC